MNHAFKTKKGQRYFTNNGNSPMGFSMCGAIGAWFADPDRRVICIIGDGGFQMNIQELQTIKNYKADIKIFISNNSETPGFSPGRRNSPSTDTSRGPGLLRPGSVTLNNFCYGITKAFQQVNFEGRSEACEAPHYTVPDFTQVAHAYGIHTYDLDSNRRANIESGIQKSFDHDGPVVCNVKCKDFHSYFPKISGWKTPIEDQEPYLSREEFRENMSIKPLLGWEECKYI